MRLRHTFDKKQVEESFKQAARPIERAAKSAMEDAGDLAKKRGRDNIRGAGFSDRWANALRVNVYPIGRAASLSPAAFIFHKIPYSGIFERGGPIQGKPLLWLPLPTVPKIGGHRLRPKEFVARFGPLASARGANPPMLVGKPVRNTSKSAKGAKGKRRAPVVKTVPLYVGLSSVTIGDKFSIREICEQVSRELPGLYVKHFRDE